MTTLTFTADSASFCYVNGASVAFPYTLANGDIITFGNNADYDNTFTVNGNPASNTVITNDNIAIVGSHVSGTPSRDLSYTIHYKEVSRVSVDLTTLAGWDALSAGAHNITVVAKASGFKDSAPSAAVQVTKAASMPAKGDIITLDSKQYRVLKTEGTVAEVLAMYDAPGYQIFGSSQTYENSSLDTYCNTTFYNSLSSDMKAAIVDKTFNQDSWYRSLGSSDGDGNPIYQGAYTSGYYRAGLASTTFGSSISRKCYVLSVQDAIDYLEVTTAMTTDNTTLIPINIWEMFWNQTTSPGSSYLWLRSASASRPIGGQVFGVSGTQGCLAQYQMANNYMHSRPAFQIDLSKISWSK